MRERSWLLVLGVVFVVASVQELRNVLTFTSTSRNA